MFQRAARIEHQNYTEEQVITIKSLRDDNCKLKKMVRGALRVEH